ncbi:hypothetical protein [Haloarchaeobius sp. HME9146]|uniref:DUF7504 family protein n=1 Tax=Haloarchaeobius sp. HME9146 TaxID=2978732 RepID=UPI0021BFFD86|nr:hypothetical protein [Haloarchaeobius sp. HME9146]MCT9096819.1 hypothetical protein [Haloarchaeobius sp. HME9146]
MRTTIEREPVAVDAGTQALVLISSLRSPLSLIPESAFENLLVVSTTRSPTKIEQLVRDRGGDPNKVGVVPVSGSPVDYDGPMWTGSVVHPNDLSGIHQQFSTGMNYVKPGEGWVVFDNVNVLLMYAEPSGVYQLVESVATQTRDRRASGAFALVRDAVADSTYDRFRGLFDTELDQREP